MTSSPLRGLTAQLDSASGQPCSWILLHPAVPGHQHLWRRESDGLATPAFPKNITAAAAQIPAGAQPASLRAEWARRLVAGLFGTGGSGEPCVILPIVEKTTVVGCVGWSRPRGNRYDEWLSRAPELRRLFRQVRAFHRLGEECRALRWLLGRSDRPLALAHPNGVLLGTTLPGREILQAIKFGPRHYFRTDAPTLPAALVKAMGQTPSGQVKLSATSTARFGPVEWNAGPWLPLARIEYFIETTGRRPAPALSIMTAVERDIVQGLIQGKTNRQIAAGRGTAIATVKNQVSEILRKSGVSRRIELAAAASGQALFGAVSTSAGGGGISVTR